MALFIGMLFGAFVGVVFFVAGDLLPGALFLMFAFESFRSWKEMSIYAVDDQKDHVKEWIANAEEAEKRGNLHIAKEYYERILGHASKGLFYNLALFKLAYYAEQEGDIEEAYNFISKIKLKNDPQIDLLHLKILVKSERYKEALTLGEKLFKYNPSFDVAMFNAKSSYNLKLETPLTGWLHSASDLSGIPLEQLKDKL